MNAHETFAEEEIRSLCARLLSACAETEDTELLSANPDLEREVRERLEACGVSLVRPAGEAPLAVIRGGEEELSELSLAALGLAALVLNNGSSGSGRPKLALDDLVERLGGEHSAAYVRRAVVGPLERRGLVKVIKPGQRVEGAYLVAGPALAAIDAEMVKARLQETAR